MSRRCLYTRILKEDKSLEDGNVDGDKDFRRLAVKGRKQEPYRSMRGSHTFTQNSCEEAARLVLRHQGPRTQ